MGQGGANALDRDSVYAEDAKQFLTGTFGGFVPGPGIGLDRGQGRQLSGRVPERFDGTELAFDFGITGVDLAAEKVEQFERLFEGE